MSYQAIYRGKGADDLSDSQRATAEDVVTRWAEGRVSSDAKSIVGEFPGVVSRTFVPAIVELGIRAKDVPMLEGLSRDLGSSHRGSLEDALVAAPAKWSFTNEVSLELRTLAALKKEHKERTELGALLARSSASSSSSDARDDYAGCGASEAG
ncbi:MAG: hypothetical protein KIT84_20075 [Labilithrix sp.]|nr:hypothetical protein [Labilithrix sp.]MCW5813337.1 hypothetical protein [Labilithrix sp.]